MTTYTAITNGQIDADSPFDVTLATQYRDNPIAITEGSTGAPKIQDAAINWTSVVGSVGQTQIGASAVGQGELKSTSGSVGTTSITGVDLTLPGGGYGFYPQISIGGGYIGYWGYNSSGSAGIQTAQTTSATYVTRINIATSNASGTANALQVYIQASPPYDLGDGEIPLFIFALIDNGTGQIEATYLAPEAPWHHNGPTNIAAKYYNAKGLPCRTVCRATYEKEINKLDIKAMLLDPTSRDEALMILADTACFELEITQSLKNRDMGLIPHPFGGNDLTGKTVVMLDPVADLTWRLFELHQSEEDVSSIIREHMTISNDALIRATSDGVIAVSASWKNTV